MSSTALLDASSGSGWMRPYHILMATVFAVALVAAYSMLPDDNELIAMLERDGHSGDAIAILEENYNQGDRRYRMLHQLLALYEDEGETVKARGILEEMVKQRPADAALRERLARFYRAIGDGAARKGALKAQIDIRYNEGACREYISLVRLDEDARAEIGALELCRQKGYRRPDDLVRLGVLMSATGQRGPALALLRAIDDVRRLKSTEDRQLLIALLLEAQQPNEAERRATRWIKSGNNQALALSIVDELAAARFPDTALKVAKAVGAQGDGVLLTVAERLLEQSQGQAARYYLKGWLDAAALDNVETLERFVAAAIEAEDPQTALAGVRKFGLEKVPSAITATLAQALSDRGFTAEAAEVTSRVALEADAPGAQGDLGFGPGDLEGADAAAPGAGKGRRAGLPGDALGLWRRTLVARMSEDAQRRASAAVPSAAPGRHGNAENRPHAAMKMLTKAHKILTRSKHLKSLKQKRRAKPAGKT